MSSAMRLILGMLFVLQPLLAGEGDPFAWLEEVEGKKALEWVESHNHDTLDVLTKRAAFAPMLDRMRAILDSDDRIATPKVYGRHVYNFWRDDENPRGLWRRTEVSAYLAGRPKWETVLDVDALAKREAENWVFKDAELLEPKFDRALLMLSRGGADATVIREFDLVEKAFVEDGFSVPEAKSTVAWKDHDAIYMSTDFGEGSLTDSGYPRIAKLWRRGTALSSAKAVFEGSVKDVGTWVSTSHAYGEDFELVYCAKTIFTQQLYLVEDGAQTPIPIPDDVTLHAYFKGQVLMEPKSDWTVGGRTYAQGALLATSLDDLMAGKTNFDVLFEPNARTSIASVARTKNMVVVNLRENVVSKLLEYTLDGSSWLKKGVEWDELGTIQYLDHVTGSDRYLVRFTNFLTPSSLVLVDGEQGSRKTLTQLPAFFDASPYVVEQLHANSKDGTEIPYFVVKRADATHDGTNPTLLYGYGGFEVSKTPAYSPLVGTGWLEHGGIYVLANIRGGGEFGPSWHQAAMKENRHKAFEDFIAVAEDLIARKLTSPRLLGIRGGSNGGLLVGTVFTMRPDLFRAVVCQVPLLDMRRYHKLLAGASWMGEYGDPDNPKEWAYIKAYSPYHNLKKDVDYPKVLFTTSTRDDRVHPGHARKMVAKMEAMGHPVYYYENVEGGHAGASNNQQRAFSEALIYTYLLERFAEQDQSM